MSNQFSSGLELANVLLTSEPLHESWDAIQNDKQKVNPNAQATLHINTTQQVYLTIITFLTSPMSLRGQEGLILSSTFKERNLPDFEFLCNKSNPSFSINEAAIKLFASRFDELCRLKTEPLSKILYLNSSYLQIQLLLEPLLKFDYWWSANSQGDQTQDPNVGIQFFDYGQLLERLQLKAFCKDVFELAESDRVPLKASIITQLAAIFGVPQSQYRSDVGVEEYKKKLSHYWQDVVEEVEKKPQEEGAAFRTHWLKGGTTYRRMMEPLHIAEYYKNKDGKNYREERPKHFIRLEEWLKEEEERKVAERIRRGEIVEFGPSKSKAQNVASSLTDDSCFWAHVEEALILCNQLENGQQSVQEREQCKKKLIEFEEYVLDALKDFAVTPDIFLKHSSFMAWWKQYNKIVGSSTTQLARIMTDGTYRDYEKGVKVVF
ncbi:senescence-associated carboxylesterase 101 [Prunus yedoensis var. nudiflora]|uniref:Senescence-associated carboxylesterase 101 n=1 Tax=Prunus yedoensis var. nudiflora TaxID=2094558 RepID=A0A314U7H9_PRUYE|nr:senescence-associated carboxylesterase 101 [Prunus yedoensis var. nudiflora]